MNRILLPLFFFTVSASANYKYTTVDENKAQMKFGNAKAISSDMYFQDKDPDAEIRSTLARYEGSSSISSADLFGGGQQQRQNYSGGSIQVKKILNVKLYCKAKFFKRLTQCLCLKS